MRLANGLNELPVFEVAQLITDFCTPTPQDEVDAYLADYASDIEAAEQDLNRAAVE